jgi:hypothetical protein
MPSRGSARRFALVMRLDNRAWPLPRGADRGRGGGRAAHRAVAVGTDRGRPRRHGTRRRECGDRDSPEDGADAAALLRAADAAMYGAKSDGRGRVRSFDPVLGVKARARAAWRPTSAPRSRPMRSSRIQPMVDLTDPRRLTGMEVLARWHHPERGWIPPAEFVPVAEEAGLIAPLTATCCAVRCAPPRCGRATSRSPSTSPPST